MNEFLLRDRDPKNNLGYLKQSGKPKPDQFPVALTKDGQPVFDREFGLRITPDTFQKFKWMAYDDEVERQRRLLADTALAQLGLEKPKYVQTAVDQVGKGLRKYWLDLKKSDDKTIETIAKAANSRLYGPTSFGRRQEKTDKLLAEDEVKLQSANSGGAAVYKAQIEQWFSPLGKTPRDVPKLMSLYDFFYCKVLGGTATLQAPAILPQLQQSEEYKRAENKKAKWRPNWYEEEGPRGRTKAKQTARKTGYPGLLSADFTIPLVGPLERCGLDLYDMQLEERNRGWDMFTIQAAGMDTGFKQSLAQHNLPFSASASGTTSTLFLAAEAFAQISSFPLEEQKEYLLACVIYLVAGGMHTCHEVFWTGKQVDIKIPDGKYVEALPASFLGSQDYEKWSTEFWDIVRPDRPTVR